MVLEEIQAKLENELDNEGLTKDDIADYEMELDLGEIGHSIGLLDDLEIKINTNERMISAVIRLY